MGQLGELSPAASVAIGIIVGLCSTSIQSIGLTLQRKSHLLEDSKEDDFARRPPYRRRRWQIGMFMFVVANLVGSTIQITTLPLPVLSTLQASGLVFNTICATLILGEPFTKWSLGGTALVAGGALLIALFGALPEPSHNLNQLLQLLGRPQFIIWMVCTFLAMAIVLLSALYVVRVARKRHNHHHHHHHPPRVRLYLGMSFGAVSAVLSSHSLLVAKSAVELLVRTIVDGHNQFNRFPSWLILLTLLALALSQLFFLHKGLKLVSTSVLYPFVFCIYNIVAILDGLIYFHQADRLSPLHAGLIALGTVILLAGVLALSWRLNDEEEEVAPPDAHNLLTPGMGIIEDTTTDDEHADTASLTPEYTDDEEAVLPVASERTPLLKTPKRQNSIIRIARQRRQRAGTTDAADILDALEDRPSARRSSMYATPTPRPGSSGVAGSSDDERPNSPLTARGVRRAKTLGPAAVATSKEFRDRRRRRWSGARPRAQSTTSPLPGRFVPPEPERAAANRRVGSLSAVFLDWWSRRAPKPPEAGQLESEDEPEHERDDAQDTPGRQ